MDSITTTLLAVLVTIFAYIIYHAWKVNQYWKERGIPQEKPLLFLGNAISSGFKKKNIGQRHQDVCQKFPNEPVIGYYDFMKPVLLIKDPEIIEQIMIKDFAHFVDHGLPVDEKRNPLDSNLFMMNGKRWKALRNKLSPIFTTGKLKLMFDSMAECGNGLLSLLENCQEVEMREFLGGFVTDVIGSCAFGIDTGNLSKADNEFRRMTKKTFEVDALLMIKSIILMNFPSLGKALGFSFNKPDVVKYFTGIIRDTIKYRRENDIKRNDFLQLMMQLQDKGYVEVQKTKDPDDDYLKVESSYTTEKFELTNEEITGQAFAFFTAGFDAITLAMMYTLYELSKNPEIQAKVQEEVQREVNKAGSITYDAVREMNYLEQCVKETFRKYPQAALLFRVCTKEYTLPNGVKIQPGQMLYICIRAVHYNATYYPEPDKYIPERFDPDNSIPSCAYIPFGGGPRICIAVRFVMLQIKLCLAMLLQKYTFKVNPKTKEPLTVNVKSFFTMPNEKVLFNLSKVNA